MPGRGRWNHLLPSEELTQVCNPQRSILSEPRHIVEMLMPDMTKQTTVLQAVETPPPSKKQHWLRDILTTLGLSVLLASGLKLFVLEARYIPSGSMRPNLEVGDRLLVDKLSHRFVMPKRGDLFIFSPPPILQKQGYQDALIKRVVGLPGEQVELKSGQIWIDGRSLPEPYLSKKGLTQITDCPISGVKSPYLDQTRRIPDKHYLVLGDNRQSSSDSRCWGVVGQESLVGRAFLRFWPLNRMGPIQRPQ